MAYIKPINSAEGLELEVLPESGEVILTATFSDSEETTATVSRKQLVRTLYGKEEITYFESSNWRRVVRDPRDSRHPRPPFTYGHTRMRLFFAPVQHCDLVVVSWLDLKNALYQKTNGQ